MSASEDGQPIKEVEELDIVGPSQIEQVQEDNSQEKGKAVPSSDATTTQEAPSLPGAETVTPQSDNSAIKPIPNEPKVKRTVEYRQETDGTLLYTRSVSDDEKAKRPFTGAVFEIVDVNVTAETKDTTKSSDNAGGDGTNTSAPIVSWVGRQFMRIYSHCVINALQSVVNYYPRHSVIGDPIELFEPYAILVHHWDALKEYREKFRPEVLSQDVDSKDCLLMDTYEHLGYILDFLEDMWGEKVRKEKERWAQAVPTASYEMLWLLLKPGTDVYFDIDRSRSREPFVVSHVYMGMYNKAVFEYKVRLWHLGGSDHRYIQPEEMDATIRRFDGERPIQSLEVFPCQYLDGHEKRKAALIKRGQRFLELRHKKCMYFDGESSTVPRREEPKWDLGLIENLVLKPHYKNLILNISKTFMDQKHASPKKSHDALESFIEDDSASETEHETETTTFQPWSADFIENKGKGLVFLLHGKPGVGKTYTAECIAEHIKRPLLPITCADIGVDPAKVEDNLVRWFKIARSWDAVMLLDEADIYMEYRQIHDLTRNNLVASFLRAIEYYEGILFLTTNRVGTFDEAFLSRINLTIYYPDFQDDEREMIWNNYFDKLEREAGDQFYVSDSTKEYASGSEAVRQLKWNGREIRNVNLAQAEGSKDKKGRFVVKRDHIKVTAELSKEFKNYMVSVHKKNESQRAQLMGYRYDAFNIPNVPKQDFI
ncbi:hypothetical protein N0V90_001473 [Kalmusia sp. IMI 367209]|nr:hypothetical protein N0V90_001473 [Kalmusia sp. IMI 367209]